MVVLIYAAKRIHFGDVVYEMRIHLAVLDWVSGLASLVVTHSILSKAALSTRPQEITIACLLLMGKLVQTNNKDDWDFTYRMRMLAGRCTPFSTTNTHDILGEWLPLECCDPRPSNLDRPYGEHCSKEIKFLLLLCQCKQVRIFSFLCCAFSIFPQMGSL